MKRPALPVAISSENLSPPQQQLPRTASQADRVSRTWLRGSVRGTTTACLASGVDLLGSSESHPLFLPQAFLAEG